jgi:hypothetical protein
VLEVETFPYAVPQGDGDATSTVAALRRVGFGAESDLVGELAYEGAELRRAFVVRRRDLDDEEGRDGLFVYEAPGGRPFAPEPAAREPLGMLLPVQRYVLRNGIERAGRVEAAVRPRLREAGEEWGFARVREEPGSPWISITPPIVESLHPDDWDEPGCRESDFIVCDGNHRLVRRAWDEGKPTPVVAVTGRLPQPYYARPLDRFAWAETAANKLDATPDLSLKYRAREVDRSSLDEAARQKLAQVEDSHLYRRYFRDLASGFGDVGTQGGR